VKLRFARSGWAVKVLTALGAIALGGCAYTSNLTNPHPSQEPVADTPERGRVLYLRDCAWCHAAEGSGTGRGPDLISGTNGAAFTGFMLSTGRMPINDPSEPTRFSSPSYNPSEIEDLVAYVASLGGDGPPIPVVDTQAGDLALGLELYQENCAACHSTTGVGGALAAGPDPFDRSLIAPALTQSTPIQIAEAMQVGPGTMPVFGRDTLASTEVDSIVRYLGHLQTPDDRGGLPLGHVGPVTEGAIGWLVGVGGALLIVRLIGTRVGEE